MKPYTNIYPAFVKWLLNSFGFDKIRIARELFHIIRSNQSSDNMIWEWLELTGDKEYTINTFIKIADNIILENK